MSNDRFVHATKFDAKKPPMDLIPWEAMEEVAQVLDFGRVKYQAHNWRRGFLWTRLASAALRHIFAWLSGQDKDPESGLSHIAHAICCLMFLIAHIRGDNMGKDDRAHKLLAEEDTVAPIPAAHVPKNKAKGYRWFYNWGPSLPPQPSVANPLIFSSREAAWASNENRDARFDNGERAYELFEVDIE